MTRVLFLGGAGMIGSAVVRQAVASGVDVTIVTRTRPRRPVPAGVAVLRADVRDVDALSTALGDRTFDAVVNWVAYTPADLRGHAELFASRTGQYVFISTCSVFGRPVPLLPVTESSPRKQPSFGYAKDKVACELFLEEQYRERDLPLTIVRPFHTYDDETVPVLAGWTAVDRFRNGLPVVVHGDGTSPWTLMHADDFARAMVPLLGNDHAIGESVNVVSGDVLTWDQIHIGLARAAGVPSPQLVHRSSSDIAAAIPGWSEVLEHDFRHAMLFDTAKLQRLVPDFAPRISYGEGIRRVVAAADADPNAQRVDAELGAAFDKLAERRS